MFVRFVRVIIVSRKIYFEFLCLSCNIIWVYYRNKYRDIFERVVYFFSNVEFQRVSRFLLWNIYVWVKVGF